MSDRLNIFDRKLVIAALVLLAAIGGFILAVSGVQVGAIFGIFVGIIVFLVTRRYREGRG